MNSFKFKKLTSWVVALVMFASILSPSSVLKVKAADSDDSVTVQVLATSDTHGKFYPYGYALNQPDTTGSLAQVYSKVKELRNANTLLLDDGDTIQDNSADLFLNDDIHPMVKAFNEMGYDAIGLGNHEFNYGIPTLQKVYSKFNNAKDGILCSNVYKDGKRIYSPYKVFEKGGVKIAVIGAVSPNITNWDSKNLQGYEVTNPVDEINNAITEIKANNAADVIIAMVHMSETEEYNTPGSGANDVADGCKGLNAIIAAHEHKLVNGTVRNGVKLVENLPSAQTIAQLNITVKKVNGKYTVVDNENDVKTQIIPIKDVKAEEALSATLKPFNDKAIADAVTKIGTLTGGDLVAPNEAKGIPTCQIQETAMINLINKVQMKYSGADVSAAAAFDPSANIKVGEIRKCDASLIYKYSNTLYLLQMTGKQLKQYMEWSAQYYNQFKDGDLTLSFNSNIRGYNYDMFTGVNYQVDVSKPMYQRIVNLTKADGTPIKDTDTLKIAVNNYRASSQLLKYSTIDANGLKPGPYIKEDGDTLPTLLQSDIRTDIGGVRELIADYIKNQGGTITPHYDNNWKVVGNNWDTANRAAVVKLLNRGKISVPVSADGRTPNVKAITWDDVVKNVSKNDLAWATASKVVDVLSFNDLHGTVIEDTSNGGKNPGIAKLATAINDYKKANPDTVVVSGGDSYQGSAMSNLTYGKIISGFMKTEGVLASAIGNHEYDWGINRVTEWSKDGGFTFLASNIYDTTTGKPVTYAKPYLVTTVGGVKIGFVGLSTPETLFKTAAANVKNVEFRDPATAASEWAKKLKDGSLPEGKVDYVIALTHLGAVQDSNTGVITGEAAELCKNATGLDAVISAHTHMSVCGIVNNIPVVQASYNGRYLADLSICFDKDGKFTAITPYIDNLTARKASIAPDSAVKVIVDKYNTELSPILDKVVGHTDIDLTHDLWQLNSVLGSWGCELMRKQVGTQICINNGGGFRAPIAKGDITMGTMYSVFPFDNSIVTMQLKGSDLKRVIENGIAKNNEPLNNKVGCVQQSGLKIAYDLNRPFGDRVISITLNDETPIDMSAYYTVATNSFMYNVDNPAKGGDNYDFTGAKNVVDTGIQMRDALVMQLAAEANPTKPVTPVTPAPIPNDEKVVPAISNAPTGSTTVVDTTKNPVISKDIFNAVKGQDKNVTFASNGVTWTFNGKDITSAVTGNIDLSLKTVSDALKAKEVAKIKSIIGKNVPVFSFSFNYEGKLPGKATVKVLVGTEWANKNVTIFRYFADKNSYEKITTGLVDKDGYLTYSIDHCSDYFITETSNVAKLPQTGSPLDTTVVVDLGAFMLAAGAAFIFANRKKEEEEDRA